VREEPVAHVSDFELHDHEVEVVRLHLDDARLIDRQGHVGGPRRIREDLLRGGVHVDLARGVSGDPQGDLLADLGPGPAHHWGRPRRR
jgi:hypothetical protein